MLGNKKRYFIELKMTDGDAVPRNREAVVRRAQAQQFVGEISKWVRKQELENKVASLAVTALGQVQIICEQDIIDRMAEDQNASIATIRSGASLSVAATRFGTTH